MPHDWDAFFYGGGAFILGAAFVAVLVTVLLARTATTRLQKSSEKLEKLVDERTAELEKSNRRLAEAKRQAETTNRAKSHFLASMSHEIRTPLTSILGYTDLLLRSDPDPAERLKNLQTIRRNGQHLLELINDVLDISKIEAGEMSVEALECPPWQLAREVRSLLKSQALAKDLTLEVEADGPIPEYVHSDPVRLRQILLNLVGNAIKFTEKGGVRLVVGMDDATRPGHVYIRFDVVDSGIGMTAEEQANVFKPFRQASSSTSRVFGGTGLGLAISRHLAWLLGGDITVASEPGKGSTFSLIVDGGPVESLDLLEGPLRADTLEALSTPVPKRWSTTRLGGRILLAEDGVDNRRFISAVLQQVGAEVTLVENGRQAVEAALAAEQDDRPFDAVLMDMQMPVLDGYEAARQLRAEGYPGTIVALTAYAMAGDREKCLEAGCDDFVAKPIDVERFLASLKEHVDAAGVPAGVASSLADHPTLGNLVRGFVERLPERLEAIESAYRDADLRKLEILAHGLRGSGGTYGFDSLTAAAGELEESLRAGAGHEEVATALAHLTDTCRRTIAHSAER